MPENSLKAYIKKPTYDDWEGPWPRGPPLGSATERVGLCFPSTHRGSITPANDYIVTSVFPSYNLTASSLSSMIHPFGLMTSDGDTLSPSIRPYYVTYYGSI